ncbi:hypothetical protein [Rhodothermus marinus]|uniref:ribonuclease toxin HepT-like protein n=1 Tax=Rhodothermus marinus TaxID=29549 RepID=UPI0034E97AE5
MRPYRFLTFSLSCRDGPLCPPDHTRRIAYATRGAVPLCTGKSAIPYYLGFRHFFRHAYTFEIDWNKLQPLITHVAVVLKQVRADISAFFETELNPGARGKEC